MTSSLYLENYLDSMWPLFYCLAFLTSNFVGLEHLPIELQRNFTLMRDLDQRAQNLMKNIDVLAENYLKNLKTTTLEQRNAELDKIQDMFNKAKVSLPLCSMFHYLPLVISGIWWR